MAFADIIEMERENLENIPLFALPDGYSIRPYEPGDEKHWIEIHLDAEKYVEATPALYEEYFGSDEAELRARQFYLYHGGEVVGTSSAWYDKSYKDGTWGRVHWLAIRTAHQGKGLSRPLLSHTLLVMKELGHTKAVLTTLRRRLIAVKLYENYGFKIVD
jgi:GNAT superfamily N-acetyltransferase